MNVDEIQPKTVLRNVSCLSNYKIEALLKGYLLTDSLLNSLWASTKVKIKSKEKISFRKLAFFKKLPYPITQHVGLPLRPNY